MNDSSQDTSNATVRERPLVSQYIVTLEAPSQETLDEYQEQVAKLCKDMLTGVAEGLTEALAESETCAGYSIRIDPLAVDTTCAWCKKPVLEQVAASAKANTEMLAAMQRVETHRVELVSLLSEVVNGAHEAQDGGDFVLWVQERLKAYVK